MTKRNRLTPSPKQEKSRQNVQPSPWFWHLFRCLVLSLLIYLPYSNSFRSGWVLDNRYIVQLDSRNKEASWENLKLIWTKDYWWPKSDSRAYRPIVTTSYLLNWSILGNGNHEKESDQVVGFHWLNLVVHGINASLVYFLMLKLLHRPWVAFFTAALFAVHPIATESVTNIIGRADEFAAACFLGFTLVYIRSTETHGLRKLPWIFGLALLFIAGCFSKESTPALIAIPFLFDGIYRWGNEQYHGRKVRSILADCLVALITVPSLAIVLFIRSRVFRGTPSPAQIFVDNPILRFAWNDASSLSLNVHNWILGRLTACNVALKGIWKLIWPAQLSSDYSYNQIPLFQWELSNIENIKAILSALFIAGTLALAVWCYRRHKAISFFIAFYWIAYAPTSNFLINTGSIMGERFLYIPSIAFCALLVLGVDNLCQRIGTSVELDRASIARPWPRLAPPVLLLLILIFYSARGYARNRDWRSDVTLAESAIKSTPGSFRPHQTLAFAHYETNPTGNIDRIIELGETAVAILETLPNTESTSRPYLDVGIYYGMKGEVGVRRNADGSPIMNDATRRWYRKSIQVLERGSEIDRTANSAYRARELKNGSVDIPDVGRSALYIYLGIAYSGLGMNEKALEAFEYARHLDPGERTIYPQITSTQLALGRVDDAVVSLMQSLIVDPARPDAWQTLTEIYSQINQEPIPAVQTIDGRSQLRQDNRLVQRHLFRAYSEFMTIARAAVLPQLLGKARDMAVNFYHLDPKLLDAALDQKSTRPAPPDPVFHTFGKKLAEE